MPVFFATVAACLILVAYFGTLLGCHPEVPGDTATVISWNLEFVFPLLGLSLVLTIADLIFWIMYLIRQRQKSFVQIALPPLLLLTWFLPPILNGIEQRRFIAHTKHATNPIEQVLAQVKQLDDLNGGSMLNLPPDASPRTVLDRILKDELCKAYTIVESRDVQADSWNSLKKQEFRAFAVDTNKTGRRVFLLRYNDDSRGYWNWQEYYVP